MSYFSIGKKFKENKIMIYLSNQVQKDNESITVVTLLIEHAFGNELVESCVS